MPVSFSRRRLFFVAGGEEHRPRRVSVCENATGAVIRSPFGLSIVQSL